MNNEEINEDAKPVEVMCNERTSKILQQVFLADRNDPFNRISMQAVISSATRGLPVNVTLSGCGDGGRCSFVGNSVCTMITMELTDKAGELLQHGAASVGKIDEDGKTIDDGPDHKGVSILQLSLNNQLVMPFISALLMSMSPAFAQGCEMLNDENLHAPDDEVDPVDTPEGDPVEAIQPEPENEPIPFPGAEFCGTQPQEQQPEPDTAGVE